MYNIFKFFKWCVIFHSRNLALFQELQQCLQASKCWCLKRKMCRSNCFQEQMYRFTNLDKDTEGLELDCVQGWGQVSLTSLLQDLNLKLTDCNMQHVPRCQGDLGRKSICTHKSRTTKKRRSQSPPRLGDWQPSLWAQLSPSPALELQFSPESAT